ncbi:MAG: hypothetical protein IH608_01000, partial [Proteobacteria bacterium]|nr:hypothetical protein [Pseudomonadota bacterium]
MTLVLGRLIVPGVVDRTVALSVERDDCAAGALGTMDNATRGGAFETRYRELCRLEEESAPTVRPLRFAKHGGADGELSAFPALYFCKRRELFFVPPCPRCGGALTDCRDDLLLASQGLPPYGRSPRRFLH